MEEKAGLVATIINLRDIQRPAQRKSNQFAVERRLRLRRSIQGIWPGIESRVCIGIKEVSANAIGTGPAKSPEKEDPVPTPTERRSCRPARASRPSRSLSEPEKPASAPSLHRWGRSVYNIAGQQERIACPCGAGEISRDAAYVLTSLFCAARPFGEPQAAAGLIASQAGQHAVQVTRLRRVHLTLESSLSVDAAAAPLRIHSKIPSLPSAGTRSSLARLEWPSALDTRTWAPEPGESGRLSRPREGQRRVHRRGLALSDLHGPQKRWPEAYDRHDHAILTRRHISENKVARLIWPRHLPRARLHVEKNDPCPRNRHISRPGDLPLDDSTRRCLRLQRRAYQEGQRHH